MAKRKKKSRPKLQPIESIHDDADDLLWDVVLTCVRNVDESNAAVVGNMFKDDGTAAADLSMKKEDGTAAIETAVEDSDTSNLNAKYSPHTPETATPETETTLHDSNDALVTEMEQPSLSDHDATPLVSNARRLHPRSSVRLGIPDVDCNDNAEKKRRQKKDLAANGSETKASGPKVALSMKLSKERHHSDSESSNENSYFSKSLTDKCVKTTQIPTAIDRILSLSHSDDEELILYQTYNPNKMDSFNSSIVESASEEEDVSNEQLFGSRMNEVPLNGNLTLTAPRSGAPPTTHDGYIYQDESAIPNDCTTRKPIYNPDGLKYKMTETKSPRGEAMTYTPQTRITSLEKGLDSLAYSEDRCDNKLQFRSMLQEFNVEIESSTNKQLLHRWSMLSSICILNFMAGWTCFSLTPFPYLEDRQYLVSVFLVASCIGCILEDAMRESMGLRKRIVSGGMMAMIGNLMIGGGWPFFSLQEGECWRVYVGFFVVGFSHPFYQVGWDVCE
jgi:hypothetical protein